MRRTTVHLSTLVAAGLLAVVVTGCSKGSEQSAASTTAEPTSVAPSSTTTTAPPTTSTTATTATSTTTEVAPQPCTTGPGAPAGAQTKSVVDVDGDGKRDTGWVASAADGTVTVGIATAAGGGASTPFQSASPVERSMLVVDADEQAPVEIILSDGRGASLYAWSGCKIVPVKNPQGQTYAFDLGDRIGTGSGIGCANTSSGRRLVGLNRDPEAQGSTVSWSQTIIVLDGTSAHNGAKTTGTYTSPADDAKIQALDDITCGTITMAADGVHLNS